MSPLSSYSFVMSNQTTATPRSLWVEMDEHYASVIGLLLLPLPHTVVVPGGPLDTPRLRIAKYLVMRHSISIERALSIVVPNGLERPLPITDGNEFYDGVSDIKTIVMKDSYDSEPPVLSAPRLRAFSTLMNPTVVFLTTQPTIFHREVIPETLLHSISFFARSSSTISKYMGINAMGSYYTYSGGWEPSGRLVDGKYTSFDTMVNGSDDRGNSLMSAIRCLRSMSKNILPSQYHDDGAPEVAILLYDVDGEFRDFSFDDPVQVDMALCHIMKK